MKVPFIPKITLTVLSIGHQSWLIVVVQIEVLYSFSTKHTFVSAYHSQPLYGITAGVKYNTPACGFHFTRRRDQGH